MSASDFEELDRYEVEEILASWQMDPPPSANWRGVAGPNRAIKPEPTPLGDEAAPVMFVIWQILYSEADNGYDGSVAPYRKGSVVFSGYVERFGGTGHFAKVFRELRQLFEEAPGDRLAFFPDMALPVRVGLQGPLWFVDGLQIPFSGG